MVRILIKNSSPSFGKAMTSVCFFSHALSSAKLMIIIPTSGSCYKDKWDNECEVFSIVSDTW